MKAVDTYIILCYTDQNTDMPKAIDARLWYSLQSVRSNTLKVVDLYTILLCRKRGH